jgi:hypothetical protein
MANTNIQLKKSGATGNVPPSLAYGELALNYADGRLYYKNASGTITYIQSGTSANSFATINSNSSLILATSATDTLSFVAGNNISISTDTINKTITINSTATGNGGGGETIANAVSFIVSDDVYVGDGSTTTFYLTSTPTNIYCVLVNINGVLQLTSSYTLVTNVLTFTEAPASGASIEVKTTQGVTTGTVNNAIDLAQAAFNKANTNSDAIAIIQGVDLGQNTTITAVNQFAQSAYNAANAAGSSSYVQSAFDKANTASANTIVIQGVDLTQNTRLDIIEGVNLGQNTTITNVNQYAQSAYSTANGANGLAQSAYNNSNTNTTNITSVNQYAASAYAQANVTVGVDATQNTRLDGIEGTNLTQNTNITTANNAAWAAFAAGNTNAINITAVNDYTTSAYNQANVTIGVDITQNTRLQSVETINNNQNTSISIIQGVDLTQNTRLDGLEGTNLSQNTRFDIIEGTDATQNTRINSIETVDNNQNTAISIIQGVDLGQNATITAVNQFTQSAYSTANSKFSSSGGTITGSVSISGNNDLTVSGNLYVTGTQFISNTQAFATQDPLLVLGIGNYTSDIVDIGFASHYNDGTNAHSGLIRDAGTKEYYFFNGYTPELDTNNNVNINHASFRTANTNASYFKGNLIAATINVDSISVTSNISVNGYSIITAGDLATVTILPNYITMDPTTVPVSNVGTSTTYGTYNFGSVTDIQTYGDYNTSANTGFYSVNDATGTPGHIEYIGFTGVTKFNRIVLNINYTASSGHTQNIDLYNYLTNQWDTFGTYSGSGTWQQFTLGVIDDVPYISGGNVTLRNNHVSSGNAQHRTWIDYVALEQSITGGQGPRGPTGATGPTGPVDTSSYNQANTATGIAQAAYNQANVTIGVDATQNTQISGLQGVDLATNAAITIIQGVDLTQNTNITTANNAAWAAYAAGNTNATNITAVNNYAASAYAQANVTVGIDTTQNTWISSNASAILVLQGVNTTQNTWISSNASAISVIQGVDLTQNTNITTANNAAWAAYAAGNTNATNITSVNQYAASAYAQSNVTIGVDTTQNTWISSNASAILVLQGVNTTQNTWISANQAYSQAAFAQANLTASGLLTANANIAYILAVDLAQNTNITTANNAAWAAFTKANNALANTSGTIFGGNLIVSSNIVASNFYANTPTSSIYVTQSQLSSDVANTNAHLYTVGMFTGNTDQSLQIGAQNFANTSNGSTDLALYNNLGTDTNNFINMGITSFGYNTTLNNFTAAQPGDAYLYSNGVNLLIGTQTVGKNLKLFVGGYNQANVAAVINSPNTATVSNSTGTLVVNGGIGVTGNLYANSVYTNALFYANGTPFSTGSSVTLSDSVSSNSSTTAATSNAVLIAVSTALAYSIALG